MKCLLFLAALLSFGAAVNASAQSGQSPVMQQSTSTATTPPTSEPMPKMKNPGLRQRMKMERGVDTTLPKDRKQKRLRPDSLRRGGATRVDSVR
jgi:hypothetical protein